MIAPYVSGSLSISSGSQLLSVILRDVLWALVFSAMSQCFHWPSSDSNIHQRLVPGFFSCLLHYFPFLWSIKDWHQLDPVYEAVLVLLVLAVPHSVLSGKWFHACPAGFSCLLSVGDAQGCSAFLHHIYLHAPSGCFLPGSMGNVQGALRVQLFWEVLHLCSRRCCV